MTYVVNDKCIKCKFMDCVEVCPVDCFYEGENMLVIHPDECIDCGVCEPECPVEAIRPDTEPGLEQWLTVNAEYAKVWPNITMKKEPPADAKDWEDVAGQVREAFFTGTGQWRLTATIYHSVALTKFNAYAPSTAQQFDHFAPPQPFESRGICAIFCHNDT